MKTVFVIDIDTTIANNEHRAALLQRECLVCLGKIESTSHRPVCANCGSTDNKITQSSWDQFLSADQLSFDTPVAKAQDAIYRMRELDMEFHFITGRNEHLREVTEAWLQTHFGRDATRESLKMRATGSPPMSASVYKEQALKELIAERDLHEARFIFMEDDPFVFRMYQRYGIVIKCPEGWEHWMPAGASGHEPLWNK